MRILFVADPLASFKIYKDTTFAMMREAQRRGHTVLACEPRDLQWVSGGRVTARVQHLHLTGDAERWFDITTTDDALALADVDAVLMRKDPPFDSEYFYATHLLEQAEREGARVFNKPSAIRDHNEKFSIAQFPQFVVPTLVSRNADQLRAFLDTWPDAIAKPLDGMGGSSIFRMKAGDPNVGVILETLTQHGQKTAMIQQYIPDIVDGDKRVLLIAGQPVPYALARLPKAGEHRGNLAAGGTGRAQPLSEHDLHIAHTLGPELIKRGLMLVGLDVIGRNLTEVNVTSPTCFREIMDQTGFPVADTFVQAIEQAVIIARGGA